MGKQPNSDFTKISKSLYSISVQLQALITVCTGAYMYFVPFNVSKFNEVSLETYNIAGHTSHCH